MTETHSPPPYGHDGPHGRWLFIRDVLVLQVKLLIGNLHNFLLIPATLVAAALDLVLKSGPHGSRFYRVLDWGRRGEDAIGLYSALDRNEEGLKSEYTVDAVVSRLEAVIVGEYAKGGTAASMKAAIDGALDQLHSEAGKGAVKAQEAAQRLIGTARAPDDKDAP